MSTDTDFLTKAKLNCGGVAGLASKLCELAPHRPISPQAISQWKRVPADRAYDVETVSGISRYDLRPDVFGVAPVVPAPTQGEAA